MTARPVAGLVLAGGRGSRLAASVPKPLVPVGGRPLIAHVLERFPAWVAPVLINANDGNAFAAFGHPVVADRIDGFQGPLAGLDAGGAWLRTHRPEIGHLLCLPGDTPFLPKDLAARFLEGVGARPRIASFGGRLHPTVGLWPLPVLDGLKARLERGGSRSILGFTEATGFETVVFAPSATAPNDDPFFNVNTPVDLAVAEHWHSR